jgi:hypothetical protein
VQQGAAPPSNKTASLTGTQISVYKGSVALAPLPAPVSFHHTFENIIGSTPVNAELIFGKTGDWSLDFAGMNFGSGIWLPGNAYYTALQVYNQYQVVAINVFAGFGPAENPDSNWFARYIMPEGGWCDFQIVIGPKPTHPNFGNPSYTAMCRFSGQIIGLI